jgi:AcrR family transcriptional regulator
MAGKQEAGLTHDDILDASTRVDPELRRRSELLWDDRARSTRGPKAAFTPDEVVLAAIEIAEADGLSAVTMHAVATQLGFTTMALYRYFPNKEALLDAIVDAGLGRPPAASRSRGDWRTEVTRWAHAKRRMLCAREWLAELPFVAAPHGPNWLLWVEALTAPLMTTGLAPADVGQMISIIDGYTRGASDTAISLERARGRSRRCRSRPSDRRPKVSGVRGAPHGTVGWSAAQSRRIIRVRPAMRTPWNRGLCKAGDKVARKPSLRIAMSAGALGSSRRAGCLLPPLAHRATAANTRPHRAEEEQHANQLRHTGGNENGAPDWSRGYTQPELQCHTHAGATGDAPPCRLG